MGKAGFEDGDASYMDGDDDQNLDIDVALSYIDERIQNVLGHYQRDFEAGASAENLGARFGGYGSFLPMYQRSPSISSNPRTKQKFQNHHTPRSPQYFPSKDAHYSAVVSAEGQPLRPEHASSITPQMPLSRNSSVDTSVNSQSSKDHVTKCKPVDLPMLQTDRKPLKFRIKLGSGSKLAQQNAAIYSGLGLGMSPYSSPEDSPTDWEGTFSGSQETLCESPSFIVKIMTSSAVPDGALLTPLHDCFVRFVGEKSLLVESKSVHVQERSSYFKNEIACVKECKPEFGVTKMKLGGKKGRLGELKNENYMDPMSVISAHQEKEIDREKFKGKEISSNSLKFTLTPMQKNKASGLAEGIGDGSEANTGTEMDSFLSFNVAKWETAVSVSSQGGTMTDKCNAETNLAKKVQKNERVGLDLREGPEADEDADLVRGGCDNFKGFKDHFGGTRDPSRQKCDRKITSHFQDESKATCLKEPTFTGGGTKSKGKISSGCSAPGLSKGRLRDESSTLPKKNLTHGSLISSKIERTCKGKDSYSVSNGNKKLGNKVNRMGLSQNPAKDCAKDSNHEISGKERNEFTNMSDERSGGKHADHQLMSNAHVKGDFGCSALAGTGPNPDVLLTGVTPVVIQENWVCCDKCHKWRLLPYGSNTDQLPKKWKCRMLNWLPGMNKCSFSEEETTNALHALYIVPTGEIQNNHQIQPEGAASQILLADDTQQLDQNQQGLFKVVPSGEKKKHESKSVSNAARLSESINPLKSEKKDEASLKSLKNENQLSLELISEKRSGDAKPSKTKRRKESDQDEFKVTIAKTGHMHCTDKDQYPGGLSMRETKIHSQNDSELPSSQDLKGLAKCNAFVSTKKQKNQAGRPLVMDEPNKRAVAGKKRKLKDWEDSHTHQETLFGNDAHNQENWISLNETSEHKLRKEVVSKESKLQDKNYTRKVESPNRRGKVTRVLLSGSRDSPLDGKVTEKERSLRQYEGNKGHLIVDGKNSVRRELPMAANSSSFKISSSRNIKSNIQDVKGSPVESVSSSPMRFSISDNLRRNLLRKGDALNALSPPICSGGEDHGGSPQIESVRNENFFPDIHDKSVKSFSNHQDSVSEHYNEQTRDERLEGSKVEKKYVDKGLSKGKQPSDSGRRETKSTHDGNRGKSASKKLSDATCQENEGSNTHQISRGKRSPEWVSSKRTDHVETYSGTADSQSFRVFRDEQGAVSRCFRPVPEFSRGDKPYALPVDVDGSNGGETANATEQFLQGGAKHASHSVVSRHPTPKSRGPRNTECPIPIRKNFSARAAKKALREAKDLKHSADRLMVSGSGLESTELFFQAALKFLHGALLLEPCNSETAKYGETTSARVYTSTAKLCEYCAHEYERCKDMASAALAYKCVEVAYMRLIYSNDVIASRDRHELQMDLQVVPSVESPSSSASDVDNVNNQAAVDGAHRRTDMSTPPLPGNHVIPARNRPSFVRLLNFAQDVNHAMEACRKSLDAYAAAYVNLAEGGNEESISSVKRVLDFSFHDIEGLVYLIRLAMEALSS